MEASARLSLDDRCQTLESAFVHAYFGHVPVYAAAWGQLEQFCDAIVASAGQTGAERLQTIVCDVVDRHPLNAFPVSAKQRREAVSWLANVIDSHGIKVSQRTGALVQEKSRDSACREEPEYIFKTFARGPETYVTLLEENRDIIGHGTTGLTSWQGALFLADWAESRVGLFQVRLIRFNQRVLRSYYRFRASESWSWEQASECSEYLCLSAYP